MTDDVFEDLVNLYLDKEINPAQLTILKDELGRNRSRQKTFESYCRMHQATHFAALSASPVIPRLSQGLVRGRNKPAFFAFNRQVFAAAALIIVIGSFASIYLNGPFGSARMVPSKQYRLTENRNVLLRQHQYLNLSHLLSFSERLRRKMRVPVGPMFRSFDTRELTLLWGSFKKNLCYIQR